MGGTQRILGYACDRAFCMICTAVTAPLTGLSLRHSLECRLRHGKSSHVSQRTLSNHPTGHMLQLHAGCFRKQYAACLHHAAQTLVYAHACGFSTMHCILDCRVSIAESELASQSLRSGKFLIPGMLGLHRRGSVTSQKQSSDKASAMSAALCRDAFKMRSPLRFLRKEMRKQVITLCARLGLVVGTTSDNLELAPGLEPADMLSRISASEGSMQEAALLFFVLRVLEAHCIANQQGMHGPEWEHVNRRIAPFLGLPQHHKKRTLPSDWPLLHDASAL